MARQILVGLLSTLFDPRRQKRLKKEARIKALLADLNARDQALNRMG